MPKLKITKTIEIKWQPPSGDDEVTFIVEPLSDFQQLKFAADHRDLGKLSDEEKERVAPQRLAAIRDLVVQQVVGWGDGIEGDDGAPLPCTPDTRALVLGRYLAACVAVFSGLFNLADKRGNGSGSGLASSSLPVIVASPAVTNETSVPESSGAVAI